jgi:hypothetical protein
MVYSVGPDEDVDEVATKLWNTRADAATIKAAVEMMADEYGWVRREKLAKAVEGIKAMMEITMYPDEVWDKGNTTLDELEGGEEAADTAWRGRE